MFGRRKSQSPSVPRSPQPSAYPDAARGHAHVLALLDREKADKPLQRVQLAGKVLCDLACQILNKEGKGVRMENLLALLSSVGGQQCLEPILDTLTRDGRCPKDIGMVEAKTQDGHLFYFGDLPNKLLLESDLSLISLAFGAARDCGALVTMDMIPAEMKLVARTIGNGDAFFTFDLPERNRIDSPLNWAAAFGPKFVETCDLYRVPPLERATTFGFALSRAIIEGKSAIDPKTAARIVLGCAVRMAKVDPRRLSALS